MKQKSEIEFKKYSEKKRCKYDRQPINHTLGYDLTKKYCINGN